MKLIKLLIVTLGVFFYGCAYQGNAPIRISENIKPESNDEKHELRGIVYKIYGNR